MSRNMIQFSGRRNDLHALLWKDPPVQKHVMPWSLIVFEKGGKWLPFRMLNDLIGTHIRRAFERMNGNYHISPRLDITKLPSWSHQWGMCLITKPVVSGLSANSRTHKGKDRDRAGIKEDTWCLNLLLSLFFIICLLTLLIYLQKTRLHLKSECMKGTCPNARLRQIVM